MATTVRTRLDPEQRREALLSFGCEHFAEHAFDSISMNEIAKKAGVSKALLYHYFNGRRGFYLATVKHVVDEVIAAMGARAQSSDDAVLGMLSAFVDYCKDNSGIYKTVIRGGLGADSEVALETDRVRDYVLEQIASLFSIETLSPLGRMSLRAWIALVESSTAEWIDQSEVTREEFIQFIVNTLLVIVSQIQGGNES